METRDITCENCGEGTLTVIEVPGTTIRRRGYTGKKGNQYTPGKTEHVPENCPNCGAKHGEKIHNDHAERVKRLQAIGATKIITSHRRPICA